MNIPDSPLAPALHASGPAPEIADRLQTYGWLVGHWDAAIITHAPDGSCHEGQGEIHAGWILQGRAIQDVWMIPRLSDRRPDTPALPVAGNWYGTTLRVYDPAIDAWHVHWFDPVTNFFSQQIGRREGDEIVQESQRDAATRTRWRFTKIKADSFHWLGERSADGGASWALLVEVLARRNLR